MTIEILSFCTEERVEDSEPEKDEQNRFNSCIK